MENYLIKFHKKLKGSSIFNKVAYFKNILYIPPLTEILREKCAPYLEFFWSVFSHIRTEYGELIRISLHSVFSPNVGKMRIAEKSKYGHFSRSENHKKTCGFLVISGGAEREKSHEMD